jgi:hypothetical protein
MFAGPERVFDEIEVEQDITSLRPKVHYDLQSISNKQAIINQGLFAAVT